jgi:exodeoxyribonuclease VII large subunit
MLVLSVGHLTAYLKELLDTDPILSNAWVRGEITSFFESRVGHCYFTLSGDGAQLKSVLFRGHRAHVHHTPAAGDAVVAHGSISIYEDQGQYQLYVDFLAPEGAGMLQLQFEELRQRLASEGLFDESRKRLIPALPHTIGVVTSAQGAVWHDITTVLRRRFPAVEVLLSASAVQGGAAPASLVAALERLWQDGTSDVIIIARGGGAPEELAVFNDEVLARAIFRSPIPVVSAVGHETDVTIADLVADLRAPTPSAAAELVVPNVIDVIKAIADRLVAGRDIVEGLVEARHTNLSTRRRRLQRVNPQGRVDRRRRSAEMLQLRSVTAARRGIEARRQALAKLSIQAELLNPKAVLARGYAALERQDTHARLATAHEAVTARSFRIVMRDGSFDARAERDPQ